PLNRNFLVGSDVDDLSDSSFVCCQPQQRFDSVADVAEATRLLSGAINRYWRVIERLFHEIWQYHPIAACLPRSHCIEKPDHNHGLVLFLPVGKSQKFIEGLGCGVTPPTLGRRPENKICIFLERNFFALPIDLRS